MVTLCVIYHSLRQLGTRWGLARMVRSWNSLSLGEPAVMTEVLLTSFHAFSPARHCREESLFGIQRISNCRTLYQVATLGAVNTMIGADKKRRRPQRRNSRSKTDVSTVAVDAQSLSLDSNSDIFVQPIVKGICVSAPLWRCCSIILPPHYLSIASNPILNIVRLHPLRCPAALISFPQ